MSPLGRHLGTAAALCGALASSSCRIPTAPALPPGAVPLTAPTVYAHWWALTEACSGVTGNLADVVFYEVPGVTQFSSDGQDVVGYWTSGGNQIVLAGLAVLDGGAVRHEMLHALIRVGGHPRDQFLEKCAGAVDCSQQCIADAGSAPPLDPAALTVSPAALEVSTEITPATPTSTLDDGFFIIAVAVHNPSTRPVVAQLGATNARAVSFQYDVRGAAGGIVGGEIVLDPSSVTFAPGETKRQLFDFSIGNDVPSRRLPPGPYTVVGAYGTHRTTGTTVMVGP